MQVVAVKTAVVMPTVVKRFVVMPVVVTSKVAPHTEYALMAKHGRYWGSQYFRYC